MKQSELNLTVAYNGDDFDDVPMICPECKEQFSKLDLETLGADRGNGFCPVCQREISIDGAIKKEMDAAEKQK